MARKFSVWVEEKSLLLSFSFTFKHTCVFIFYMFTNYIHAFIFHWAIIYYCYLRDSYFFCTQYCLIKQQMYNKPLKSSWLDLCNWFIIKFTFIFSRFWFMWWASDLIRKIVTHSTHWNRSFKLMILTDSVFPAFSFMWIWFGGGGVGIVVPHFQKIHFRFEQKQNSLDTDTYWNL